jgi:hypothetical protein
MDWGHSLSLTSRQGDHALEALASQALDMKNMCPVFHIS